jgi:rubrerythrin
LAHELYLAHLPHVPDFAKSDFRAFIKTEEKHRRIFEKLYREIAGVKQHPTFPVSVFLLKCVAQVIRIAGFQAICRFECAIEERAIADYERALLVVQHARTRKAIQQILEDEELQLSLHAVLQRFQAEEKMHIKHLQKDWRKKISTV